MVIEVAAPPETNVHTAWARVRGMKDLILKHRHEGDELRRLPDSIAQAFLDADLFRIQVPSDLGGLALDPITTFDLGVEISSYDGSVGWNFGIGASAGPTLMGAWPLEKIKEVFSSPDCCLAGSFAPPGKAVAVKGGYRLTGRWQWASCIHQAKWVAGAALVYDGDKPRMVNGRPVVIFGLMPRDTVTVHDVWHVGGMKGTGSTEWSVTDLFVPAADAATPGLGESAHPAPQFRNPSSLAGSTLCAVAVGIAKGTVESFKEFIAKDKTGIKDAGYAQYAVGKAEALYESSQLYVEEAIRPMWENTLAKRPTSLAQRARARRAYVHAVESSVEAVTLCYNAVGGAAIFDANPFHRNVRDVYAVSPHIQLSRRFMELAGQAAFGTQPNHPLW